MPMGKPYGMKEMTAMTKQGEMSPIPDGQLYREPLDKRIKTIKVQMIPPIVVLKNLKFL